MLIRGIATIKRVEPGTIKPRLSMKRALQHQLLVAHAGMLRDHPNAVPAPQINLQRMINMNDFATGGFTPLQHMLLVLFDPVFFSAFQYYMCHAAAGGSVHLSFWIAVEEWRSASYNRIDYGAVVR